MPTSEALIEYTYLIPLKGPNKRRESRASVVHDGGHWKRQHDSEARGSRPVPAFQCRRTGIGAGGRKQHNISNTGDEHWPVTRCHV